MAYLMGYGDTIQSHTYTAIYWSSIVSALKKTYPELVSGELERKTSDPEEDVARVDLWNDRTIYLRSQIDDYRYCPVEFESVFFLDYFVDTYEERIKKQSNVEPDLDETDTLPAPAEISRVTGVNSPQITLVAGVNR
ncbi:hypothetical protein RSAG8_11227, partial [Rhizoctonia solani AG-8 WAC10335]